MTIIVQMRLFGHRYNLLAVKDVLSGRLPRRAAFSRATRVAALCVPVDNWEDTDFAEMSRHRQRVSG